jgi:hypothetical protein
MGSLTLVLNMILAPALCNEEVEIRDVYVNIIVISGTLISIWFGPHFTPGMIVCSYLLLLCCLFSVLPTNFLLPFLVSM